LGSFTFAQKASRVNRGKEKHEQVGGGFLCSTHLEKKGGGDQKSKFGRETRSVDKEKHRRKLRGKGEREGKRREGGILNRRGGG